MLRYAISREWAPNLPLVARARRQGPAEIWLPQGATALSLTTGAAGVWGAWTNLGTPLVNLLDLTYVRGIYVVNTVAGGTGVIAIEIGSGSGAVTYAQIRGYATFQVTGATAISGWLDFSQQNRPLSVPASTQLQARAWNSAVATQTYETALLGWDTGLPPFSSLPHDVAVGVDSWSPSDTGAGVAVTGAALPNFGAWATLVASVPADILVYQVGLSFSLPVLSAALMPVQLGIGAVGAEVALSTSLVGHVQNNQFIWPPVWAKAGERLAARVSGTGGSVGVLWKSVPL